MSKEKFVANLINEYQIEVFISKDYDYQEDRNFYFYENGSFICELKIISFLNKNDYNYYLLEGFKEIKLGFEYEIQNNKCLFTPLNCSVLGKNGFNNIYKYDGELGAIYTSTHTLFRVFAPLASEVYLQLFSKNGKEVYVMKHDFKNGIYYYDAIGDYDGFEYLYLLKINGKYQEAVDPYAKSLTVNSKKGVIIDFKKTLQDFNDDKLPRYKSVVENVIYELSVRDFTSSIHSDIENKGKFLGLCEEHKVTENHNPIGIDYLKYLGVTHIQVLPVSDFLTTNELFPELTYNWGYDPYIMFSLEGSYARNNNPYSRINDFKKMISTLHKNGIRVILDMVFNHQFSKDYSAFDKTVPNYYFRFNNDGSLSNGSFCGNELESRNYMVRKYIVDCCLLYVREYHIDGFRFDLMGSLDVNTIKEIYDKCKQINRDFMIYGEGWDIPSSIKSEEKTIIGNAFKLEEIGFFNDRYRDIVKGKSGDHELGVKGYLLGDINYFDAFIHCYLGSCINVNLPPLFASPTQSINYIECHDNATLYDKLLISNSYETEEIRLKRINLVNVALIFSCGVNFIHSGQEIGLSKKGVYNSYNSGDEINGFDTTVLDKRFYMAKIVSEAISLKKSLSVFNLDDAEKIKNCIRYENYHGRVIFSYNDEIKVIINPLDEPIQIDLHSYYKVLFNEYGKIDKDFFVQTFTLNGVSLVVLKKS